MLGSGKYDGSLENLHNGTGPPHLAKDLKMEQGHQFPFGQATNNYPQIQKGELEAQKFMGHQPESKLAGTSGRSSLSSRINQIVSHQPFDFNSYPLTNPPIFDPTLVLGFDANTGKTRRRRISISNGQIGQIVNNEAFFISEDSEPYENYQDSDSQNYADFTHPQALAHGETIVHNPVQNQVQQLVHHEVHPPVPNSVQPRVQNGLTQNVPTNVEMVEGPYQPQPQPQPQQQASIPKPQSQSTVSHDPSGSSDAPVGVPPPDHILLYNNEVIYNPNEGPIPGTAAWKKERLLERNRIAASKCRQRKKQAQQQLRDTIMKHEAHIRQLETKVQKYEKVLRNYHKLISDHKKHCLTAGVFDIVQDDNVLELFDDEFIENLAAQVRATCRS